MHFLNQRRLSDPTSVVLSISKLAFQRLSTPLSLSHCAVQTMHAQLESWLDDNPPRKKQRSITRWVLYHATPAAAAAAEHHPLGFVSCHTSSSSSSGASPAWFCIMSHQQRKSMSAYDLQRLRTIRLVCFSSAIV